MKFVPKSSLMINPDHTSIHPSPTENPPPTHTTGGLEALGPSQTLALCVISLLLYLFLAV